MSVKLPVDPSVQLPTDATPLPPLVTVAGPVIELPAPAVKVTATPLTGLFEASLTITLGGVSTAVLATANWLFPPNTVIEPDETPVAVATMVRGDPASPAEVAEIDWLPAVAPSVHTVCTLPKLSLTPLDTDNEPPPVTTANVTVEPATPLPAISVTRTVIGVGSAEWGLADCPAPAITCRIAAAPAPTSNEALVAGVSPVALAASV